jgi:hypothetical protein
MNMKILFIAGALLVGTAVMAAEDEAALKEQMHKVCAPLFAPGGECADLVKGTRKCTRQHLAKGGAECGDFEKAHKEFFDAGMKDELIHK